MAQIINEYAEAMFSLACENSSEKAVMDALEHVNNTFKDNPEYMTFLTSPGIPLKDRIDSLQAVFGEDMPEHTLSFIQLLCEKGRIAAFADCVTEYSRLLKARESMMTAKVTSAVKLTEEQKSALKQKLEKMSGNAVELECSIDASVLGGLIVEYNGTVIDGSLRHRLKEIKDVINQ